MLLVAAISLTCATPALCAPATEQEAVAVVSAWLARDSLPLGTHLGSHVSNVQRYMGDDGSVDYFVVNLDPSGFVVVSGDDLVEPIIAFAAEGNYDPSPENPLASLVTTDARARKNAVKLRSAARQSSAQAKGAESIAAPAESAARDKWRVLAGTSIASIGVAGVSTVSDVRVAPLIATRWSQSGLCGNPATLACYNYYVPSGAEGNPTNYPCGCVATAMAQVMRFHQYPTAGIGVLGFTIEVDRAPRTASTRGGDGSGGPYDWANMTNTYGCSSTETQRKAVGALCYDAGLSVNMSYAAGGSGAYGLDVATAFKSTFDYSNAVKGYNGGSNIGNAALSSMINPNLDAALPVCLGISGPSGGHLVVCDGYGYDSATLYHHLNMGWGSTSDAWYNLPNIDAFYTYNTVTSCTYSIYTSGTGEIISGRVLDSVGNPIPGASVWATRGATTYGPVSSNAKGIYALAKLPSNKTHTVNASHPEYIFAPRSVLTGTSSDYSTQCGNVPNSDLTGSGGAVVTGFAINNGSQYATSYTVILNNTCTGSPTHYMASESPTFAGRSWQPYSVSPSFVVSTNLGAKTIYFKVKNAIGTESSAVSDTVILDALPPTSTMTPDGGVFLGQQSAAITTSEPATVYYTVDGSEPTTASPVYSAPIPVTADVVIRFFGIDTAGNHESPKKTGYFWIATEPGSISDVKALGSGLPVRLVGKALYYIGPGFAYLEEQSRVSGIRLEGQIEGAEGMLVALVGTKSTTAGEPAIVVSVITPCGELAVRPFGVTNAGLVASSLTGINVTVWGMVKPGSVLGNSYVISDGSPRPGVRVVTAAPPIVSEGSFVTVTGAAGLSSGARVIYTH